ncbi:MAG: hypothetical protein B2I17_03115 [Thermoplasmatales archaeon B_DKE]|nr:MAG: hypothetical protein B2I17_03115 [Thermoplasmatales archaeon B_DKE]
MEYPEPFMRIATYLKNTEKIRDAEFTAGVFNSSEKVNYVVTPWEMKQVILNTAGIHEHELSDYVSKNHDILVIEDLGHGNKRIKLRTGAELPASSDPSADTASFRSKVRIMDIFSILLYLRISALSENGSSWVKKEDAIFGIKNSLNLPDDFIPQAWMSIVENDNPIKSVEPLNYLQDVLGKRLVYTYSSFDGETPVMPYFFYIQPVKGFADHYSEELLSALLTSEFEKLRTSHEFRAFTLARILKTVIFNIETKKLRELKKPLFDQDKIRSLREENLVDETDGRYFLTESLSLSELKSLREEFLNRTQKVSLDWMEREVQIS